MQVQARRFDILQAADVDEDGTLVELRKAIRDLRKAVNRQRRVILSKVQTNYILITAGEFTVTAKEIETRAKSRLLGNKDLLLVLDLQVALEREISGSLIAQKDVKRKILDQTVTEVNVRTYGTIIDAIYLGYYNDNKPLVLGENAVAHSRNLVVQLRKKPTIGSTLYIYYDVAILVTQVQAIEEDTIRNNYAKAGQAISLLKRERDDEVLGENGRKLVTEDTLRYSKKGKERATDVTSTVIKKEAGLDDKFRF